jgi:pilus assembly protein CpaC
MSRAGTEITYEVTVSAVAHAGNPLAPGVAPRALGDPNGLALPTQAAPSVQKYAHNPVVKELEVPRVATIRGEYPSPGTLGLMAGSSRLIDFAVPLRRVAIADSPVADVEVIGPTQVMVVGHQPGFTTLITWDDYGNYREQVVRVDQGGPQQIQLNVVVAELNRTRLEEQGIDISTSLANAGVSVVGLPGGVASSYNPSINLAASGGAGTVVALPPQGVLPNAGSLIPLLLSSTLTYGLATQNGQVTTNSMIQLLERHDLAKILAEPRLIAESGQEAKFLSGGEIPIVIAQALNTSIVFKQFGTSVNFVPTVIDDSQGEIELQVRPEFSQPDFSQGVQLFGFTVPAFVTRRAETKVRLHENQTLIIAGLILNTDTSQLHKVPYLGDMPYLGAFFRHTYWNHVRSELLMTVTPQLIQPIPANAQVALPIERAPMTREEVRTRQLSQPDITRPRLR